MLSAIAVVAVILIAAFKSGLIRFLNPDSLSRIAGYLKSFAEQTMTPHNLKVMMQYEVRFNFQQSCLIRFFVMLLGMGLLLLFVERRLKNPRNHNNGKLKAFLETASAILKKINRFAEQVEHTLRDLKRWLETLCDRLQVLGTTGIWPARCFRRDVNLQVVCNGRIFYGGVRGFRNRSPVVRLNRMKFWSGNMKQEKMLKGQMAAGKNGVWLFFGKEVRTNEGLCSKVFVKNNTTKEMYFGQMEVRCTVGKFNSFECDDDRTEQLSAVRLNES